MSEPQHSLYQKTVLMRALHWPQRSPSTANLKKSFLTMAMRSPPTTGVFSLLLKLGSPAKVYLLLLVSPRQPREKTNALTAR